MLRIAIVDDMKQDIDSLVVITNKIADDWGEEFHINSFESGEAMCAALSKHSYDVILLDIQMSGMDGAETAIQLKKLAPNSYIIFITSYDARVKSLFDTNVIGFIDKPANMVEIQRLLASVYERIQTEDYFIYSSNGVKHAIKHVEILYICKLNRKINIRTMKETIEFSETLESVWSRLETFDEFAMINRSYIANLKYVKFLSSTEIEIFYKDTVCDNVVVGRKLKGELEKRYMQYMTRITKKES